MTKMTKSQEKTLYVLQQIGDWANHWQITQNGGSCASLPRLVELGLVQQFGDMGHQSWRSITDTDRAIEFDYAKINPYHRHIESLSDGSCRFVTGAQTLVSLATTMGEVNGHTAQDILMEAINYIIKQEVCGQPLEKDQAEAKAAPLVELLQEGCFPGVTH